MNGCVDGAELATGKSPESRSRGTGKPALQGKVLAYGCEAALAIKGAGSDG